MEILVQKVSEESVMVDEERISLSICRVCVKNKEVAKGVIKSWKIAANLKTFPSEMQSMTNFKLESKKSGRFNGPFSTSSFPAVFSRVNCSAKY
jgi:hypothetical protein